MKYVLITGATSGIGYEFTKVFAQNNYGLVLVATNKNKLKSIKENFEKEFKVPVYIYEQDLGKIGAAKELYTKICTDNIKISILINNAGFGLVGPTHKIDINQDEKMLILNIITLVELSKLFIEDMYKNKEGKILNISSTGAFQPGPFTSTYFASKSFVLSYSRAIRYEAKKKGIQVCTLCPGTTNTNFFIREGKSTPKNAMSPERVAKYAYKKLMQNKEIIVPGIINKSFKFIPTKVKMYFVAKMKS